MLQNTSKTLGFQKIMVYKTPPGGGKPYLARGLCGISSKGLKNEFETAVVHEPSVLEQLKFYCIYNFTIQATKPWNKKPVFFFRRKNAGSCHVQF